MKVFIFTNQEEPHFYFSNYIAKSFPEAEVHVIAQGKKKNRIRKYFMVSLGQLNLHSSYLIGKYRLEVLKYLSFLKHFGLDVPIIEPNIVTHKCKLGSPNLRELIENINPELCFVLGGKLIPTELVQKLPKYTLHLHCGIVPYYRGGTTWYSNFAFDDLENLGYTVQLLDSGVDTGDILHQKRVKIRKGDSTWDAYCECIIQGTRSVVDLGHKVASGASLKAKPQIEKGFNHNSTFLFNKHRLSRAAKCAIAKRNSTQ